MQTFETANKELAKQFQPASLNICDQCLIKSTYLYNNRGGERILHFPKISPKKASELKSMNY